MTTFHLAADKLTTLDEAVGVVDDGDTVALGGGLSARLPMALVRALVRRGVSGLRVVGSAHGIDVDLLVGAGAVAVCEESYVGFEQDLGLAPAFRRAAQDGALQVRESSCVTILAQLRAAEMGVPFLPVRGLKGTDLIGLHPEYGTVICPFTAEELVAVPALSPDVALLHAPFGDASGNLHLDQPYVLDERFAHASRDVVATVDRIADGAEVAAAGVTVPGHCVTAVVVAPFGAHPASCYPGYPYDRRHLTEYVQAATAGAEAFEHYLDRYVRCDEQTYQRRVDARRLTGWDTSNEAWMAMFR